MSATPIIIYSPSLSSLRPAGIRTRVEDTEVERDVFGIIFVLAFPFNWWVYNFFELPHQHGPPHLLTVASGGLC